MLVRSFTVPEALKFIRKSAMFRHAVLHTLRCDEEQKTMHSAAANSFSEVRCITEKKKK
jgi:hypothetical protein